MFSVALMTFCNNGRRGALDVAAEQNHRRPYRVILDGKENGLSAGGGAEAVTLKCAG